MNWYKKAQKANNYYDIGHKAWHGLDNPSEYEEYLWVVTRNYELYMQRAEKGLHHGKLPKHIVSNVLASGRYDRNLKTEEERISIDIRYIQASATEISRAKSILEEKFPNAKIYEF